LDKQRRNQTDHHNSRETSRNDIECKRYIHGCFEFTVDHKRFHGRSILAALINWEFFPHESRAWKPEVCQGASLWKGARPWTNQAHRILFHTWLIKLIAVGHAFRIVQKIYLQVVLNNFRDGSIGLIIIPVNSQRGIAAHEGVHIVGSYAKGFVDSPISGFHLTRGHASVRVAIDYGVFIVGQSGNWI